MLIITCAFTSLSETFDSASSFSCFLLVPVSILVMINFSLSFSVVYLGKVIPWLQTQELSKQRRTVSVPGRDTQRVSLLTL